MNFVSLYGLARARTLLHVCKIPESEAEEGSVYDAPASVVHWAEKEKCTLRRMIPIFLSLIRQLWHAFLTLYGMLAHSIMGTVQRFHGWPWQLFHPLTLLQTSWLFDILNLHHMDGHAFKQLTNSDPHGLADDYYVCGTNFLNIFWHFTGGTPSNIFPRN